MRALVAVLLIAACGPKPEPVKIPTLPGDGDTNVAKPPPPKVTKTDDPWTGKELIGPPALKAPSRVELPALDDFKLSNGLQVYVVKSDKLPIVSMQLAIKAGRQAEPRARLGVAELTADLLVKGTRRYDAAAIARKVDLVGGTITADATFEATLLSCSVLVRDASTCMDLLPSMVEEPAFDKSELDKQRDQMRAAVAQRMQDPATLAAMHVQNLLWSDGHVRGWINSEDSISALKRDDLVAWHKTWFAPNNAILVVTGDVDGKKLKGDLERAFSGWDKSKIPPIPTYPEPGLSGTRIRVVDWPGLPSTQIRVAQFGIKHDDARFFDSLAFNHALGANTPWSRFARVLRGGGGSSFDRNVDRGSYVLQTVARNTDAVVALKVLLGEITHMQKDGPTDEEVAGAIASIAGGWGLRFQSASDIGAALVGAELHGYGIEYLTNFGIAMGHVDSGSAKRAASEILDTRNFVVVFVGDAKDIAAQLDKEGMRYEKVAFNEPVTKVVQQPAAPVDAKAAEAARKLVDDAVTAKGGRAKIAALQSYRMVGKGTTNAGTRSLTVEVTRTYVAPDKLRIDAELADDKGNHTKLVYAAAGATGWAIQPDQPDGSASIKDIPKNEMAALDFDRWRDPDHILLAASEPTAKLTPMPDETIDGKPNAVVVLASPFVGIDVTLYVDRKTKMLTRMSYTDRGFTSTDDYADYREVGGLKIAYTRPSKDRVRETKLELTKVELNVKVDPDTFAKPAKP